MVIVGKGDFVALSDVGLMMGDGPQEGLGGEAGWVRPAREGVRQDAWFDVWGWMTEDIRRRVKGCEMERI